VHEYLLRLSSFRRSDYLTRTETGMPRQNLQPTTSPAERRMIRDGNIDPKHIGDRTKQSLGLTKRLVEYQAKREAGLDGDRRINWLTAALSGRRRMPRLNLSSTFLRYYPSVIRLWFRPRVIRDRHRDYLVRWTGALLAGAPVSRWMRSVMPLPGGQVALRCAAQALSWRHNTKRAWNGS
jgi:hypothetical protein